MARRLGLLAAVLQVLHVAGWGAYYSLTRLVYSGENGVLYLLSASETLPTVAGLLGARLAERRGYRAVLLAWGLLEALGLAAAGAFIDRPLLLASGAFLASLAWSIAGPQLYAMIYTLTGSTEAVGLASAGATLGYSLGALAPLAARELGAGTALSLASLPVAAAYLAAAVLADGARPGRGGDRGWREDAGAAAAVAVVAALVYVAGETVNSAFMGRLAGEAGATLYSFANTVAGLLAAAAKPLAGRLVDAAGPWRLLPAGLAAYTAYVLVLSRLQGPAMALAWVLPVSPFVELSLTGAAYSLLGEHRGAAVLAAAYSLAGAAMAAASLLNPDPALMAASSSALAAASSLALARQAAAAPAGAKAPPRPRRRR